jgi:hypothetical protein
MLAMLFGCGFRRSELVGPSCLTPFTRLIPAASSGLSIGIPHSFTTSPAFMRLFYGSRLTVENRPLHVLTEQGLPPPR